MQLTTLKSKLHRACVTHSEVDYEGSCAMDIEFMRLANIRPFEQLHIYNVTNGERFITYAIEAGENSKIISINGAAAHKAQPKDRIIICTYAVLEEAEMDAFDPALVYLDEHNNVVDLGKTIATQVA